MKSLNIPLSLLTTGHSNHPSISLTRHSAAKSVDIDGFKILRIPNCGETHTSFDIEEVYSTQEAYAMRKVGS